jgi:probable rRNA maturation factor
MSQTYALLNKTKGKLPRLPFEDIKNEVLGEEYELSLVFISEDEMQEINLKSRNKNEPTNILSFELSKDAGEIFICPTYTKGFSVGYLFIHGLMHLKGYAHGSTMETEEQKVRKQFSI